MDVNAHQDIEIFVGKHDLASVESFDATLIRSSRNKREQFQVIILCI